MKRKLFVSAITLALILLAGCNSTPGKDRKKLSLHQADSMISARHAWNLPFREFSAFVDSLREVTGSGNPVSDNYFFHSILYGYNLNHSLRIPYQGFTADPNYRTLLQGVNFRFRQPPEK